MVHARQHAGLASPASASLPGPAGNGRGRPAVSRSGLVPFLLLFLALCWLPKPSAAFDRFDIVTTEQLKEMLAGREAGSGEDFLLVNTLDDILYRNEHIPGSVSLPWPKVAELYEAVLGPDKHRSLIFY